MNTGPASQSCPVDLHYRDPEPVDLPLAAIVGRGLRLRRRRRLALAAAAVAACAVLGFGGVTAARTLAGWLPSGAESASTGQELPPISSEVAHYPPVGGRLTLLSRQPRNWTTVAWGTHSGGVCWAAYRTPMAGSTQEFRCPDWGPSNVPDEGGRQFGAPDPGTLPIASGRGDDLTPWVGLVNPRAAKVTMTFFGHDFSAPVLPVPVRGGKVVGAFLIWLRLPPNVHDYGGASITSEIAYDAYGHILAQHGPWK